jgi:hypothetical protein
MMVAYDERCSIPKRLFERGQVEVIVEEGLLLGGVIRHKVPGNYKMTKPIGKTGRK